MKKANQVITGGAVRLGGRKPATSSKRPPSPGGSSLSMESGPVTMPRRLTAENGAKALLSGSFSEFILIPSEDYCGCGQCDFCIEYSNGKEEEYVRQEVVVSWATIKKIYQVVVENRLDLLSQESEDSMN